MNRLNNAPEHEAMGEPPPPASMDNLVWAIALLCVVIIIAIVMVSVIPYVRL